MLWHGLEEVERETGQVNNREYNAQKEKLHVEV